MNANQENPAHLHEQVLKANESFHDQFVEYYEQYYQNVIFFEKNQQRVLQNLQGLRRKVTGDVLVDLGCGTGNIGRLARDLFGTRYGVDISAKSLEKAMPYYAQVFEGDVCHLEQFEDNSADLVTGYSLLHHMYDPFPVLQECKRILKPSGYVYFDNDPNSAYFLFSPIPYLPESAIDWIEKMIRKVQSTDANLAIDENPEVYKLAEFHHYYGGRFEGFFPRRIRKMLIEAGFQDVEMNLFHINRQKQDLKCTKYSFFSQFRYSQMCVMAERA